MPLVVALAVLGLAPRTVAQEPHRDARPATLGLALAGGGALGFAHVGVILVLEELGISADVVAGTSFGSIVGALYAAGYSGREMLAVVESTNWNRILYDTPTYANLDYEEKNELRHYRARLSFREGDLLLRTGASAGQRAVEFLDDLLRYHALTEDFATMPRPLAIVAADLISGEEVVLTGGDLKSAVRASIAVPGVFAPLFYDGRYLIDGG